MLDILIHMPVFCYVDPGCANFVTMLIVIPRTKMNNKCLIPIKH